MVQFTAAATAALLAASATASSSLNLGVVQRDTRAQGWQKRTDMYGGTGGTSNTGERTFHRVMVSNANASVIYTPDTMNDIPPGDVVQFWFYPKNHTVTESSFDAPCKPLAQNLTSAMRPGQKSGFVPVTNDDKDLFFFNLLVNDTKPIWIYCGQATHCQNGMAMVINQAPGQTEKTLENYKKNAKALLDSGSSSSAAYGGGSTTAVATAPAATGYSSSTLGAPPAATTPASSSASSGPAISGSASVTPGAFGGDGVRPAANGLTGVIGLALAGIIALL